MPRGRRNPIDTEAKRKALPARHEPHWHALDAPRGAYLGCYRPEGVGPSTWRLRVRVARRYAREVLGAAPDETLREGDRAAGHRVIDYDAALELARIRARQLLAGGGRPAPIAERSDTGEPETGYLYAKATVKSYTVKMMLLDHAKALAAEGKPLSGHAVERAAAGPLFAALADLRIADVRGADLIAWRDQLAASSPLRRGPADAKLAAMPKSADAEARRRRRVRVNRLVTDLKAARNRLAKRVDWLPPHSAAEFAKLEKFGDSGRGKVRPLDADEVPRLLDACSSPQFRDLVLAGIVTGARYSELARLRVGDFRRQDGKVHFDQTKDEKERGRDIALGDEGVELFSRLAAGRSDRETMFHQPGGAPWKQASQIRPMRAAVDKAKLSLFPHRPTFHSLRDTFATTLLRSGVRLEVVSELLGHSSVELTRRHYAAFAESDLDAAARTLPRFSRTPANISALAGRKRRAAK